MLDEDVINIAQKRIEFEIIEQNANLKETIERIKGEMSARGDLHSGITLNRITGSCTDVIKNRAHLAWQTLFRFLMTAGISYSDTLAEDLKVLVAHNLPENMPDVKGLVQKNAQLVGSPNLFSQLESELDNARTNALTKIGTEIDLFAHSIKRKAEISEKEAATTVFNIYSPVGAIQTGDNSIANITQKIDGQARDNLIKVLEEIAVGLECLDMTMPHPKEEIIELIHEGQKELKKPIPNNLKLRSMLMAIGISIQTIASIKPAYETLKQTLTFLGISLP